MNKLQKQFKFSGKIAPQDVYHQFTTSTEPGAAPDKHYIAPVTVNVDIIFPTTKTIGVPQYATTVIGTTSSFNPSQDCQGYFMSYKFQVNNNCYNYGCNIATSSFAQPGRRSGYLMPDNFQEMSFEEIGEMTCSYAQKDGLVDVGKTMAEVINYRTNNNPLNGHFVALVVSSPISDISWQGDFHWVRCDNSNTLCNSWSQKDGDDQVTNFDFAGNPISDPSTANWTVNQGPLTPTDGDCIVSYQFYRFLFVPANNVNII